MCVASTNAGFEVGYITATVPGEGASNVQYTVTSDNADLINVGSNGLVTLSEQLDFETATLHLFTVQVRKILGCLFLQR